MPSKQHTEMHMKHQMSATLRCTPNGSLSRTETHMPTFTQTSFLASLAILISCQTTKTHHAAGYLIAAQVVREDPKPVLDAMGEAL